METNQYLHVGLHDMKQAVCVLGFNRVIGLTRGVRAQATGLSHTQIVRKAKPMSDFVVV